MYTLPVAEQAKLQFRLPGWRNPPVAFGDTGHPCCPQQKQLGVTNKNRNYIRADLAHLFSNEPPSRIWVLLYAKDLTTRDENQFNEAGEVLNAFGEIGYRVKAQAAFESVRVLLRHSREVTHPYSRKVDQQLRARVEGPPAHCHAASPRRMMSI